MTTKHIFEKILKNKAQIRGFGVKRLGIFGSYAAGRPTKSSDIDVLVDFSKKSFDNYMDLKFFLELLFKKEIDLVTRAALKPLIKPNILKQVKYVKKL
ncbi:MAG: nucleotidyltransferase family protein [Candidatus Margulisiibacteriota bacterium]